MVIKMEEIVGLLFISLCLRNIFKLYHLFLLFVYFGSSKTAEDQAAINNVAEYRNMHWQMPWLIQGVPVQVVNRLVMHIRTNTGQILD